MAESAVKVTANMLGKVLVEEGKYLWGAEHKVAELRNELLWMQRFLKKAESLENRDEIVDQWVLQIKEYVSEAEDIVDDFIIDVVSSRRQTGWVNKFKRFSCIGKELWALHQAASSIDSLTSKISKLTPKLTTYGVNPGDGLRTFRAQEAFPELEGQRMSYAHLEHKKTIGLHLDTQEIVRLLMLDQGERRGVVAIYGMGGLGKTTLAAKVYNHADVRNHFMYHAWAYISKQFQFQNVLKTLLADLTSKSPDMFSGKKDEALIKELSQIVQKNKCLVVLDDVWGTKVWDSLEAAFPRDGGALGSRVLLTTRKQDVAIQADPGALPKPERLTDDESWELLKQSLGWVEDEGDMNLRKEHNYTAETNGEKNEIKTNESHGSSQQVQQKDGGGFRLGPKMFGDDATTDNVENLGKEMVKNCNGIPLAIVVLGGILRKKESMEGWRLVSENLSSYLRRGNDHGKSYMEVLVLSYTDLPYHLKPCFLHLGNFPEDYEIQAEKVYRMWVAEGLITWPYDRLSSKESLEDIANECLSLLAQAGMVQIMDKASNGRIRSIRIHDLMRDVCLYKAATENFFSMIDHRSHPDEPQSLSSSLNHSRLLHMAIYLGKDVKNYLPDFLTSKAHKYLRSLLIFDGQEVVDGEVQQWMKRICIDFPWLRVLDIEGLHLKGRLTKDVEKMKHLRYLSLKGTYVSELPSSIGNLMFLQTLDLRVSFSGSTVRIPNTLWKLERLRHLFLPKKHYEIKKSRFLWLHTLKFLEILKNLEVGILKADDLQALRKLKKLSIKDYVDKEESIRMIVDSPASRSGHLQSCSLCVKGGVIDADPRIFSRFDCLHLLKVTGKISCLEIVLPQSLTELHMESCKLRNEHMKILGKLRHLEHLSLGYDSFGGERMICGANSFPQLVELNLQGLENLEEWTLEGKSSMRKLKKAIIMDCNKLKSIPDALPRTVHVTCSPCISGIEKRGTCNYYGATFSAVDYEEVFVGRADDTIRLVNLLMDDQFKKVVLFGSPGIGKATLVKSLDSQPKIRERFDAIVRVRCPRRRIPISPTHFFKELLRKLDPVASKDLNERPGLTFEHVMRRQKCLVILIDLASPSEDLKQILETEIPDGSKILLTTDSDYPPTKDHPNVVHYNLKRLPELESIDLFKSILRVCLSDNQAEEKAEPGKRLLELCSGKPQSIIMLAGVAMKKIKKSSTEWEIFKDKAKEESERPNSNFYALCYDDLPTYLKDCFLYLANFPENTEISSRKLYQMWIAAGFVSLKDDGVNSSSKKKKEGSGEVEKLLENIAASYLNELVARGLVQVGKRSPDKRICTCHLHITLRNLCLQEVEKKGSMLVHQVTSPTSTSNGKTTVGKRILKRMFFGNQRQEDTLRTDQPTPSAQISNEIEQLSVYLSQSDTKILDDSAAVNRQLKSLLFFPEVSNSRAGDYNKESLINIFQYFSNLRVLDLEGMQMIKGTLPESAGKLSKLKFLSLKGTNVDVLPSAIRQLSQLQSLDLRVVPLLSIQFDSFIFHHLKHLYLPDSFSVTPSSALNLGGSHLLQTLGNLHTVQVDLDCMSELKNLRRMSVNHIHSVDILDATLYSKVTTIDLSIKSETLNDNPNILSEFQYLNSMTIKGRISRSLDGGMLPKCLKELRLKHTELVNDPAPVLKWLEHLTHLCFDHDSFLGKKITFFLGFPSLTHLTLRLLSNLEELDMTEASRLKDIKPVIIDCWRVKVKPPILYGALLDQSFARDDEEPVFLEDEMLDTEEEPYDFDADTDPEIEVSRKRLLGHHPFMELLQTTY